MSSLSNYSAKMYLVGVKIVINARSSEFAKRPFVSIQMCEKVTKNAIDVGIEE